MARSRAKLPPEHLRPSPLVVVPQKLEKEEEDPILDASFILEGAKMYHKGGLTPLDMVLKEREVPVTEEMMGGSRAAVRALVEQGLVSHIVLCWTREMQLASNESIQWTKWVDRMTKEGKHLRSSMAVRFGEYRLKLTKAQLELGNAIIKEVRSSAMDKPSKNLVRSYLPRGVNPLEEAVKNGQNPIVNGKEPTTKELARTFDRHEEDPDNNYSIEPED